MLSQVRLPWGADYPMGPSCPWKDFGEKLEGLCEGSHDKPQVPHPLASSLFTLFVHKDANPLHEGSTLLILLFPKGPLPNTITSDIRILTYEYWRHISIQSLSCVCVVSPLWCMCVMCTLHVCFRTICVLWYIYVVCVCVCICSMCFSLHECVACMLSVCFSIMCAL